MTTSSSTFRRLLFAAVSLFIFTQPAIAMAGVRIVDVMYDPPGADIGHEWIEVQNNGTSTVDLLHYRLFEGGVNHKLTAAVGTSSLPAGAEAIITTDPAQYATDHPEFSGTVFKSSFSLSNIAETIALKDASLNIVDSYSYTAPPVVKAAPKTSTKTKKASTSTTKTASAAKPTIAASEQVATPMLANFPQIPIVWLYGSALGALLLMGIGGALYLQLTQKELLGFETSASSEEFELE